MDLYPTFSYEYQNIKQPNRFYLFLSRLTILILSVISILTALAWNDYFRLKLKIDIKSRDSKEIEESWRYAWIITLSAILYIAFLAGVFGYIPDL